MAEPHDIYGRYSDENLNQELPWCGAGIVIQGEWFPCDLVPPHDGWAHSNRVAEAMWHCGDKPAPPPLPWMPEPHLKGSPTGTDPQLQARTWRLDAEWRQEKG